MGTFVSNMVQGPGLNLYEHFVRMVLFLQASLHSAFSQCGPIYYISLPLSPCNDGIISDTSEATPTDVPSISMETEYAFVTFFSSLAAKSALLNTHRTLHIGRRIIKAS